jgi:antitoxin (DNA-binding transcriptional repressor) of toxin-antitoxin stability system
VRTLSMRELRSNLSKLDQLLHEEKELIVTQRGKPIARIVPSHRSGVPSHADLRSETSRLRRSSAQLIREDRDRNDQGT